jgi:2,5-diketo-D-gluconate reductase B
MPKKRLKDGTEIPLIGFGTWQLEGDTCYHAVKTALELGYRHVDTAYIYYNHQAVARAIGGFNRDDLFLTTKIWREHLDPDKVEFATDLILRQLGVDYVDLMLIHWPDNNVKMYETIGKMTEMKKKGKVKSIGVSNFTINHLKDLLKNGVDVSVNQVEFHPYLNQKELLNFCNENKIALTAYSPLARGEVLKDSELIEIGKKYLKNPAQVTLRWILQKEMIAIPKASSKEHIKENFEIFDFELSDEDMSIIDGLHLKKTKRLITPDFHEFNY